MAEEKKDYIVEYLVRADISQAAESLTALTTMMENFQRNHAASIRQASTAADRILKARERFSKGFVDKLDLSKPISQLEGFQKKMVKTFSNLSNMMVAMNKGDFEQLEKTLGYLQKTTGDVGNTAKKTTANIISGTKKVSDAVVSSTKKQTTATNAQTQAIIKQDNALSKLYKRINDQKLKGYKSLTQSKNVFTDDERKQLKDMFGRNWASKSIGSIENGILKQMGNPTNASAAANRAHATQIKQAQAKRDLIKGIIDKVKKAEVLKDMQLTKQEQATLKGVSTQWSRMKSEKLIGKLDKMYADIKLPKGISDISKLEAAETKQAAEALAKKAASAQKPVRQTLTKDEQKEFNKLQNKLKPLFASEEKYKAKVDDLTKKALGKKGLNERQDKKLENYRTLLSGVQDKQKEAGLARYKELAAKDAGFEKTYQKNLAEYERLSQIAAQNQAAATTTPAAAVTPATKGKAAPKAAAAKAGGINPFGMLSTELNERVTALKELMTLSSSGKVVTIPIRLDTTGVFGMLERIKGEIAYIRSIARGLQIGKLSTGGVTSTGGAATKGGKKVGKNANQVMVDLVPGNIEAFRKQIAGIKNLPVKVDPIPNLDKLRTRLANAKGLKITVTVDTLTPAGKKWTPQSVAPSRGTTTTQGTAGRRPPVGTREMQGTRKQIMRSSAYPLVGNTSFGVQTPAFVNMAKGMVGMMGIGAAFGLIGDAMHQAVEYQNTMMSVKAILESNKRYTGYTPENFRAMEKNIRRVGMDTKFTAPEVAGAARFMAMAGLSVDQINNSIRPIADVALIGDNDLETTADKITNIQTAFKLGKDPRSMRKLADNLTTTFTRFNTDMMMTAEAMQYAAPVASAAGLGIEDTLAMIGVMGNAGIQSSMAGTTLRMAMQNIIKPNKNQKKLWDKLGISRHNADGSPRNIVDVLTELRSKASDAELMETVSNLFRTTSMAGTVQIIRNLDLLKAAREDMMLGRDTGISEKLSYEKQNTIKGLWAQVTSAFTEDNVLMFEKFQTKLKEMLIDIRDYLRSPEAIQNLEHIMELIKTMGSAFGTVAKIWMELYNTFPGAVKAMMVLQFAMSQIGMLLNPFIGLYRVIRNLGIVSGVTGAMSTGSVVAGAASGAAGLRGAFTAARAAGSFGTIGTVAGAAMSGLGTTIGTVAGAVTSPVGLAILGIATTVGLIYKDIKDKDNAVKKFNEKSKETKGIRDNAAGILNNTLTDNMIELATKTGSIVNVGQIMNEQGKPAVGRKWVSNPTFRHTLGYSQLFDADMMKRAPMEYVRSIYDQFVAPASGGSYSFENFRRDAGFGVPKNMGKVGYIPNSTKNAQAIAARYALQMEAVNSSTYTGARDKILDMFGKAAAISDKDKRIEAFRNARTNAMKIIDAYRPGSNDESIRNMSADQIANMTASRRYSSFDFKYAIVENLTDMMNGEENPLMQKYLAIEQLDKLADSEVAKRVYWLQRSIGGIAFTGINMEDQMIQLNLQIHNGQLSFQEYLAKIQAFKLKVNDTVGSFLLLSLQAAKLAAANGDLPEGVTIDTLGANMGGFGTGSKLTKEQSQWLAEKGRAYALEKGIDPNTFSLTNGSHAKQKKDIDNVVSWYRKRMGLNFESTNTGSTGGKTNDLTNPGAGGSGKNNPASPYTPDQSSYGNHYQRSAARPTQINFSIQNLVNIDKTEINTMEERELVSKLEFVVSQAATQLAATAAAQLSALGSTGGDTQDIG